MKTTVAGEEPVVGGDFLLEREHQLCTGCEFREKLFGVFFPVNFVGENIAFRLHPPGPWAFSSLS